MRDIMSSGSSLTSAQKVMLFVARLFFETKSKKSANLSPKVSNLAALFDGNKDVSQRESNNVFTSDLRKL